MLKLIFTILSVLGVLFANNQAPFIGGNQFNNYYTNPNLINNFLGQISSSTSAACDSINGIGLPILAIKQALQSVDHSLAFDNNNTNARIIFLKEQKHNSSFQTSYKLVVQIKSFSNINYLAVEGIYKQVGFPAFEVTTYYMDSDLNNIKDVLEEYGIHENSFIGCGNVKAIYSQENPNQTAGFNIPPPHGQNSQLINSAPNGNSNQGTVDPDVIAQIIKLLQSRN